MTATAEPSDPSDPSDPADEPAAGDHQRPEPSTERDMEEADTANGERPPAGA